jgi:glycosidase
VQSFARKERSGNDLADAPETGPDGRGSGVVSLIDAIVCKIRTPAVERGRISWLDGATVYGVVVRNFGGGRFQGFIDRLDDLADLGIAALWLAPVTKTIPGCFGYEVTDYLEVRPEYGTLTDLRRLVDEAHARNLRVILDFVPNHTSSEHPWFRHAELHGAASPYYDFYDRDETGAATHYFDWTHLPNLNFENPDVRRFVTEAMMFWVREMDVDGFRVDVAWGIRQRRSDYWPEFAAEFRRAKPDGLLIAEASARDPWYLSNGFDAAYDWTDQLGVGAWTDVFEGGGQIGRGIQLALTNADRHDPDALTLRFLNNNDTGPRFLTRYGPDMYRVASAMLLTLPGLPCVYTGDEVGAEFEPYSTTSGIDWTDRHRLRAHFRKLIRLRRELPGLRSRNWTPLATETATDLLAYVRRDDAGGAPILVVLNFDENDAKARFESGTFSANFDDSTLLNDVYNDSTVNVRAENGGATCSIPIPGWGIRVLVAS